MESIVGRSIGISVWVVGRVGSDGGRRGRRDRLAGSLGVRGGWRIVGWDPVGVPQVRGPGGDDLDEGFVEVDRGNGGRMVGPGLVWIVGFDRRDVGRLLDDDHLIMVGMMMMVVRKPKVVIHLTHKALQLECQSDRCRRKRPVVCLQSIPLDQTPVQGGTVGLESRHRSVMVR